MIDVLGWDSEHFGLSIGRVKAARVARTSLHDLARESDAYDCVYLLADPNDAETADAVATLGFRFVDARLTLAGTTSRNPSLPSPVANVRPVASRDLAALESIASAVHTDSRFYFDRRFSRDRVDEMYRIWIRNSVQQFPSGVLVVDDSEPRGYITCRVHEEGSGEIGLVGVAPASQNRGYGRALLQAGLEWFAERRVPRVVVVTQGRNVRAQRIYEHAGFRAERLAIWYHRWSP